ncbi:MAG: Maf family protein [Acidobacteriota bacterium]
MYHSVVRLVLASASPRRAALLRDAGFDFEVIPAHVDERLLPGESPRTYVMRLADEKARAVSASCHGAIAIGADTVVLVDNSILGKPKDDEDARRMLAVLSGRTHDVLTGLSLRADARWMTAFEQSRVTFARLNPGEIDWYVASGEPRDKAGGYAIQGLASRFVTAVEGSYANVVGLPVSRLYAMLRELGLGGWPPPVAGN